MQDSFIRQNNQFVRMADKWILIDGPWYDELTRFTPMNEHTVRIPSYEPIPFNVAESAPIPKVTWLTWEVAKWHNGHLPRETLGRHLVEKTLERESPMFDGELFNFSKSVEHLTDLLMERYHRYLAKHRRFIGWYVYPDGKIPMGLDKA